MKFRDIPREFMLFCQEAVDSAATGTVATPLTDNTSPSPSALTVTVQATVGNNTIAWNARLEGLRKKWERMIRKDIFKHWQHVRFEGVEHE